MSFAGILLATAASASSLQTTTTHCGLTDVSISNGIVDRELTGCGAPFSQNVLWNLDRSDAISDGTYTRRTTGKGAVVYIYDTGVEASHDEFQREGGARNVIGGLDPEISRGQTGFPCPGDSPVSPCSPPSLLPLFTHGTAVASVVAGRTAGVAPDASIVAVRTLGATITGMDWALDDIVKHAFDPATPPFQTAIVNMSAAVAGYTLGDGTSTPLLEKMKRMIAGVDSSGKADPNGKKFLFVVVAGNRNDKATLNQCTASGSVSLFPGFAGASVDGLITVGGIDDQNHLWAGSCVGSAIDILAPAAHVLTASISAHNHYRGTQTLNGVTTDFDSGTSYAAPYVCGLAARLLEDDPSLTPVELEARIKASASYVTTDNAPAGGRVAVVIDAPPPPPARRRRIAGS
jgi:subtilisin family serine protease